MCARNAAVSTAVQNLLSEVDRFIAGGSVSQVIPARVKNIFDTSAAQQSGSVRLASAFFVYYVLTDPMWDIDQIPVGVRGEHGDKFLSTELTRRHIKFHNSITAFGENLGTKGAVRQFHLGTDPRFKIFIQGLKSLNSKDRVLLAEHIAWLMFSSRLVPKALPALPEKYLTYARALSLAEELIATPSEGHIQQFLVASFLMVHRNRFGHTVFTHHPHAADKFDGTVGDIEEFRDELLVAAYEVTVRDDWKNRLEDFFKKMQRGRLTKYIIFASGVRGDALLSPAAALVKFTTAFPMDLAIVDIGDFFSVFCAELSQRELVAAFNRAHELLLDPKLCGRIDIIKAYAAVIDRWIARDAST